MAMAKYGNANVVHPGVSKTQWGNIRTAGQGVRVASGDLGGNLVDRASELLQRPFDPKNYLLTHATIIASVDVFTPTGEKTGSILVDGQKVNRKFGDFRVTNDTQKYINNNKDAWSRGVLAKAYPTFVGGHNFVEHVQIEELSKGRIIDAVARDIGDSLYVDILIATDRSHKDLITAIRGGKMSTLSMGCTVDGTICTKCGHWAADETEMCNCIKYMKGNTFYDAEGRAHIVAELCGHLTTDPTGGVHFIEGSWVGTPAFTGAVLRNIVDPTPADAARVAQVLNSPPPEWAGDQMLKAAHATADHLGRFRHSTLLPLQFAPAITASRVETGPVASESFLAGWMDDDADSGSEDGAGSEDGEDKAPAAPAAPAAPDGMENSLKELEEHMLGEATRRVKDRMKKKDVDKALDSEDASTNDSLVKQASVYYKAGLDALVRTASSDAALVNGIASFNHQSGIEIPIPVYRAALTVGRVNQYKNKDGFLNACQEALGHAPSRGETRTILRIGKLLSRRVPREVSVSGSRQGGQHHGS